jgi:HTH-type transcriptional regulator/antitoxin HipB
MGITCNYLYYRYIAGIPKTDATMQRISTPRQIGVNLSARRKALGLTQGQVAARLGLSQNRLSVLEARPETLTVEQLLSLLNALGLDMHLEIRSGEKPKSEW